MSIHQALLLCTPDLSSNTAVVHGAVQSVEIRSQVDGLVAKPFSAGQCPIGSDCVVFPGPDFYVFHSIKTRPYMKMLEQFIGGMRISQRLTVI
jgi:hypothetical protein